MDKLEISSDEVLPLTSVAPGVVGLRIVFVNVFAITEHGSWTLIDAGLNGSASLILHWARAQFGGRPPDAIILTHGHFDHVGALDSLIEEWKAPVYAHTDEMSYLTGQRSYPPPDPSVGGGLMARMASLYSRGPSTSARACGLYLTAASFHRSPAGASFTHRGTPPAMSLCSGTPIEC